MSELPIELEALIGEFCHYLGQQLDRSPHTVRAYESDLRSCAVFLCSRGITAWKYCDLISLRGWLAIQVENGVQRSTIARKVATLKSFFKWANEEGPLEINPAHNLKTPKTGRSLPHVLAADNATDLLQFLRRKVETVSAQNPIEKAQAVRDWVIVELLYATGMRVSELTGINETDIDTARKLILVRGKGRKERLVPYGDPAQDALTAWSKLGRPSGKTLKVETLYC